VQVWSPNESLFLEGGKGGAVRILGGAWESMVDYLTAERSAGRVLPSRCSRRGVQQGREVLVQHVTGDNKLKTGGIYGGRVGEGKVAAV